MTKKTIAFNLSLRLEVDIFHHALHLEDKVDSLVMS